MKTIIITILPILLITTSVYSQKVNQMQKIDLSKKQFSVNKKTFSFEKNKIATKTVIVFNSSNSLRKVESNVGSEGEKLLSEVNSDKDYQSKLKKALSAEMGSRYNDLIGQKVFIGFFMDSDGLVQELQFIINKDSNLLAGDYDKIESALNKKYRFNISRNYKNKFNYATFFIPFTFF